LRHRRGEEGVALVEFTLVAGILLFLCFAMIELGLVINAQLVLSSAAREGARRAAVDGGATLPAYQRMLDQLTMGNLDPRRAVLTITPRQATYGAPIAVTLDYAYPIFMPILRGVFGHVIDLRAEVITRSERLNHP
jgi:Flp pilus assembly protein TadG